MAILAHFSTNKSISLFVAFAMIATSLGLIAGVQTATGAAGEIQGTVFRDENFDGAKAGDVGEPDVTITVTDSTGAQASAVSGPDGSYSVSTASLTGPFTVAFTIDPTIGHLRPGPIGPDSRSDIQVAADGAENVDFGVINPAHYCQANPTVVTNCYVEFDQVAGPNSDGPVLVQTEYLASGDGTANGTPEVAITNANAVGTTWGLAVDNRNDSDYSNNIIYAASFMKRFAGYGPGGPGAIYQLDANGTVLNTFNIAAGTDPHDFTAIGIDVPDAASYGEVGKQSFGDIDISEDGTRLYVVNMFDRTLYEIDVEGGAAASLATTNSWSLVGLPSQTCTAGTLRPMAVGVNDGQVFVGTTCDGEGGTAADLVAHIHRMTPSVGTFTHVESIDLDYARTELGGGTGLASDWRVWNDTWVADVTGWGGTEVGNPQPVLSDIEFDNGSLVLGIRDRYGDQTGYNAPSTNWPADPNFYSTDSGGDMLRVCKTGPGAYAVEGSVGCEVTNGSRPNSGPGGDEWYDGDNYITGWTPGGIPDGHSEIGLGGLAANRPADDIIGTGYDTLDDVGGEYAFSNGLYRLDHVSGDKVGQYRVVAGGFGKAAGLGDIEAHCDAAPVEIGNFVWLDADKDGIQDPDETPLEGVVVTLSDGTSVTTGADGFYSFTVEPNTAYTVTFDPSGAVGVDGTSLLLSPSIQGTDAELDSDAVDTDGVATISLTTGAPGDNDHSFDAGFFEPENRVGNLIWFDANNDGIIDDGEKGIAGVTVQLLKEDGTTAGLDTDDLLIATTTTDANGVYWFEQVLEAMTYYVAIPEDQSAATVTIGGAEIDPATLVSSTGGDLTNNNVDNTDDGEPIGTYLSASGPIDVGDGTEPTAETDTNVDPARDAESYVEAAGGTDFSDDDSNLTVDLGFVQNVRIGNLVWLDGDNGEVGFNNGEADPAESANGLGGVLVELYLDDDGTPGLSADDTFVDDQTTTADGEYWFDDLTPDTYVIAIPAGQTGQTLDGTTVDLDDLVSSTVAPSSADAGVDDVDDGDPVAGFASASEPFAVDYFDNPTDEAGHFGEGTAGAQEAAANTATLSHTDNNSDLTLDFGFVEVPLYRLGNLVWWDVDDDGTAEAGEPGIKDVAVELWEDGGSAPLDSTLTDADGHYWFEDLPAGDYFVVIPDGQTGQMIGADLIDLEDLFISSTQVEDPDDPATGNNTDNDNDGNADASTSPVAQPATSGVVSLGDPDEFSPSEPLGETLRSDDAATDEPISGTDELLDNQSNLTVDIGYVVPVRVGNVVWLDDGGGVPGDPSYDETNEDDGQADPTESGIEGVLVQLLDADSNVVAETLTDANGVYVFDHLATGTFQVAIPADQSPVVDLTLTPVDGALDALRSSTGQSTTPETADDDDDGEPEDDFASISAPFQLDYAAEAEDELGDYQNETGGLAEAGVNSTNDWLPDNHSNLEVDFGFSPEPTYQLGNLLWEDYDNDGIAESGEPGIPGVLIQLVDESATVVAETVTDADGHYLFTDLTAGDYSILVPADQEPDLADPQPDIVDDALEGLSPSPLSAADPDLPSDVDNDNNTLADVTNPDDYVTDSVTLGEGSDHDEPLEETLRFDDATADEAGVVRDDRSNLTVDLGFWRGLRLGNQVFLDGEQDEAGYDNGIFDVGESGIGGVAVELFVDDGDGIFEPGADDGDPVATTTTDTEGNYLFTGLDEATPYIVAIPSVTSGYSSTGQSTGPVDADNDDDGAPIDSYAAVSDVTELTIGDTTTGEADTQPADDAEVEANDQGTYYPDGNSELTVDFGFIEVPMYRIGNLVWEDTNDDGIVDPTELGIEGVLVQLVDADGTVIAETLTDATGEYSFDNLLAGDYQVQIPADQVPVVDLALAPIVGALDGFVSSDNGEETNPNLDVDNNDNGLGTGDWVSGTTTLGSLPLTPPFGTEPADEIDTRDGSDDDPDTGVAGSYPDAQSNYSVDFGFYRLTLGNQVWFDENDNGVIDPTEVGIENVVVNLYEPSVPLPDQPSTLVLVDTTTTGPDGTYLFSSLAANVEYVVEIDESNFDADGPLENLFSSTDPATGAVDPDGDEAVPGDGIDSDDNGTDPAAQGNAVQSSPITLAAGDEPLVEDPSNDNQPTDANGNLTVDFGFHNGLRLGNLVWIDDGNVTTDDEDGIAEPSELGVDGVAVQLYLDDGPVSGQVTPGENTLVAETETAGGGLYEFEHLSPGTYVVLIPQSEFEADGPLVGHTSTTDGAADETTNNDDDGLTIDEQGVLSGPVTLNFGDQPADEATTGTSGAVEEDGTYGDANSNLTIDFGFVESPLYRIGNLVWEDIDDDGVAEAGEPSIAGVLVQLVDSEGVTIAETLTDADGHYAFEALEAGDYVVQIPVDQTPVVDLTLVPEPGALDGMVSSDVGEELDPDDDVDNNDNGLGVGDWVAAPVTVGEGVLVGEPTDETVRSDDPTDDDLDGPTGWPDHRSNYSVDFGFYRLTLGNQVWFDADGDGLVSPDETGINDVTVELYEVDEAGDLVLIATTQTGSVDGADGIYSFDGLTNGAEYVVVIPAEELAEGGPLYGAYSSPDPATGSPDPDGDEELPADGIDNDDNGADPASDEPADVASLPVTLMIGDEPITEDPAAENPPTVPADTTVDENGNLTVDFGFVGLSIGNTVWLDLDEDGSQGVLEPGVESVVVELWATDLDGNPVGDEPLFTTTTDETGNYLFVGLEPGDYVVRIPADNFGPDAPLEGVISTPGNGVTAPDPDDDVDSVDDGNPAPEDGWVQSAPVTIDFGTEPEGESGTDPAGFAPNASNFTVDFGFVPTPPMSLGNIVWVDTDNSGILDPTETGAAGVTVELWPADETGEPSGTSPVAIATTDDDGYYLFTDLVPGEYVVVVPASNFDEETDPLFGFSSSSAAPPTDPDDDVDLDDDGVDPGVLGDDVQSLPIMLYPTLEPSETDLGSEEHGSVGDDPIADIDSNLTVDFGFYPLSLGNQVFADTDNSGTMDPGEPGIADVLLHLVDAEGNVISSTTTDADGMYLFSGFPEGDYQVVVDESNFVDGAPLASTYSSTGNDEVDSGGNPTAPDPDETVLDSDDNGQPSDGHNSAVWTESITLSVGTEPISGVESDLAPGFEDIFDANSDLTVDLGFYNATLTTVLWIDDNNDGVAGLDEEPLPGVIVNLLDEAGNVVATTTSNDDGTIVFEGLPEGTYRLEIVAENFAPGGALDGYVSTTGREGSDAGNDPDTPGEAVISDPFDLTACGCPTTNIFGGAADAVFGFITGTSVGDLVWSDTDGDGVQDPGEPGLANVTVNLLTPDGDIVTSTTTGTDGSYVFDAIPPGEYMLDFEQPSGYTGSPAGVGSDPSVDSDANPSTGRTPPFLVTASAPSTEIDAGFVPVAAPSTPSGPLAFSGSDSRSLLGLGAILVLLGMTMVAVVRRRRLT